MKNVRTETCEYVKITQVPNDVNEAASYVFTTNVHCVYPRLQHKPSVALETYQSPVLAFRFRLREKLV